jgi:glucose/arabinose dehydrogenase
MERRTLLAGLAGAGAVTLLGCSRGDDAAGPSPSAGREPRTPTTTPTPGVVEPRVGATIAEGLEVPWGLVFLANGDALVSQRDAGTVLRVTAGGDVTTVGEVPGVVGAAGGGEGGLLGIAVPPGDEGSLFAYLTTSADDRVVRMDLGPGGLGRPTPVLTGIPSSVHHHGGRLLFDPDGLLFVSTGDAEQRDLAQDRGSPAGKILRITQDGSAADGNPFGNRTWSYGHRNVEGLALDADGRLWATEFGDKAADELNLITRGGNYGWPRVEGTAGEDGLIDPLATWGTDECSPAGLAITSSTAFLGALQGECLFAVQLEGTDAGRPVAHFAGEHGRIRTVATAPDGSLWMTTSNTDGRSTPGRRDDRILRVTL